MRHRAGRHSEASHSSAKPAGTWVALESIEPQSCGCGPSTVFVGEESTGTVDGTPIAFWIVAFAQGLAVPFQQQVCARVGVEVRSDIRFDRLLRFTICHTIALALLPALDAHKHMRAIGGNSGNRCDATEEQYAVSARIGDVWKPLKRLANLGQWSGEARAQVAAILILNPGGYCHETHRPEFRNHAARLQGPRESGGAGREQLPRLDADLSVQRLPPFRASRIARWISAVPPNQKIVRVGWPAGRLGAIKRLQLPEDFRNAQDRFVHTLRR